MFLFDYFEVLTCDLSAATLQFAFGIDKVICLFLNLTF